MLVAVPEPEPMPEDDELLTDRRDGVGTELEVGYVMDGSKDVDREEARAFEEYFVSCIMFA